MPINLKSFEQIAKMTGRELFIVQPSPAGGWMAPVHISDVRLSIVADLESEGVPAADRQAAIEHRLENEVLDTAMVIASAYSDEPEKHGKIVGAWVWSGWFIGTQPVDIQTAFERAVDRG